MERLKEIDYYLGIARAVAKRATCLRRQYGAIIVVNRQVVASGYCGAPRKVRDCLEREKCLRQEMKIPQGERYELCRSVHAEQNAIINASRAGVSIYGGDMYIWGYCKETKMVTTGYPCLMCLKMAVNTGMKKIHYSVVSKVKSYGTIFLDGVVQHWNDGDVERLGETK